MTVAGPVWCPFLDEATARDAADSPLDDRRVACANMLVGRRSLLVGQDTRFDAEETGVLFKTEAALPDRVIARLEKVHPYHEPAIVGWRRDAASPATIGWLEGLGA